jgi:uncharacterized protein with ParB-like and HNH nuclease domain
MAQIALKTIGELLGETFIVPYYQRGYRWGESQVAQLLNDILDFSEKNKSESEFYFLQPIVVKSREEGWELIDGQQRLTTIAIILKVIEKILKRPISEDDKAIFCLKYEVRFTHNDGKEGSTDFGELFKIDFEELCKDENKRNENIDFYCICKAYDTIGGWFGGKKDLAENFLSTLLKKVKVMWYAVEENADGVEIFSRLNRGKIPLTNAELIKALFLRRSNFPNADEEQVRLKQLQIAAEWDEIERTLQRDDFRFFIFDENNKNFSRNYDTRIEYIFDIEYNRKKDHEDYYTFFEVYKELKPENIESVWKKIKSFFNTLKEWYEDNELYHLIGYLVTTGMDISSIKKKYNDKEKDNEMKTKSEFRSYLKDEIKGKIGFKDNNFEEIRDLRYGDDNLKRVLLLFNVLISLKNKGVYGRFPFDRYKKVRWEIEHVVPQTEQMDQGLETKQTEDENTQELEWDEDEKHQINNLVLLDRETNRNREYGNSHFYKKRSIILKKIEKGSFVPIGTQYVFLKAFSEQVDNLTFWTKWTKEDGENYVNTIIKKFKEFFNENGKIFKNGQ